MGYGLPTGPKEESLEDRAREIADVGVVGVVFEPSKPGFEKRAALGRFFLQEPADPLERSAHAVVPPVVEELEQDLLLHREVEPGTGEVLRSLRDGGAPLCSEELCQPSLPLGSAGIFAARHDDHLLGRAIGGRGLGRRSGLLGGEEGFERRPVLARAPRVVLFRAADRRCPLGPTHRRRHRIRGEAAAGLAGDGWDALPIERAVHLAEVSRESRPGSIVTAPADGEGDAALEKSILFSGQGAGM